MNMPKFPYMPAEGRIRYVAAGDPCMRAAREVRDLSGCVKQRTGAVVVAPDGGIIGRGNNDTALRPERCPRDEAGYGTGEGYHLCQDTCRQEPGRHAERDALRDAGTVPEGSTVYLSGHWWCCKPCWDAMLAAGVTEVVLLEGVGPDTDWGRL